MFKVRFWFYVVASTVFVSLLGSTALSAAEPPAAAPAAPPSVPFTARATADAAYVFLRPQTSSPKVGLLHEGATVTVTGCDPDCAAKDAWAMLGTDGAIKLSLLRRTTAEPVKAPTLLAPESLEYGRTADSGTKVYQKPLLTSAPLSHRRLAQEMAFLPNPELRAKGWLERVEGGFVQARGVTALNPSALKGEANPRLPLAFVLRELGQAPGGVVADRLHRYDRLPVQSVEGAYVLSDKGKLPRKNVRLIALRSPPPSIPADAKWVHVDIGEQTLTAYEGNRPVMATLISTGRGPKKADHTRPGLYAIEHKLVYSNMLGKSDEPYAVDRVPYTIYFYQDEALHGTYWHDDFGTEISHGCVNLSMNDAKWLFDWSPPKLPAGWSDIEPKAAGLKSLWVLIEAKAPLEGIATAAKPAANAGGATYSAVRPLPAGRDPKN